MRSSQAADQKEKIRGFAVGRSKMNFLKRAAYHHERRLEQIGLLMAGMQQSQTAGNGCGTKLLPLFQAFQQILRITDLASPIGQYNHIAQDRTPLFST